MAKKTKFESLTATRSRPLPIEQGYPGTTIVDGYILDENEQFNAFNGEQKYITVDNMRNDAVINAIEQNYMLPIKQASISFKYENDNALTDKTNDIILEKLKKMMQKINFSKYFSNSLTRIRYGHSEQELIWKYNQFGELELKDIAPRKSSTIKRFLVDNHGRLEGVEQRSEEHTSELQSHSFISYAVFCLKKKNIKHILKLDRKSNRLNSDKS